VLQLLEFNCSCLLLVVKIEDSSQTVFGFHITCVGTHYIDKLFKAKFFVYFSHSSNYVNHIWISSIQSDLFKYFADFKGINLTASIFIEDKISISEQLIHLRTDSFPPLCWRLFAWLWAGSWFIDRYRSHYFSHIFRFVRHCYTFWN